MFPRLLLLMAMIVHSTKDFLGLTVLKLLLMLSSFCISYLQSLPDFQNILTLFFLENSSQYQKLLCCWRKPTKFKVSFYYVCSSMRTTNRIKIGIPSFILTLLCLLSIFVLVPVFFSNFFKVACFPKKNFSNKSSER